MALNVGRLRPVGFAKRGAVPGAVIVPGTFISPTLFPRYVPPWNWNPDQPPLESPAHSAQRENPVKADKGPASLNGKKLTCELEPTDVFGNLFTAGLGLDTVTGDGTTVVHAHNFESLDQPQLPVYDFWDSGGTAPAGQQNGFAAMMMHALEFQMNKGLWIVLDTEWNGLYRIDDLALSPVVAYDAERPLHFAQSQFWLDDVQQDDNQVFTMRVENAVMADHVNRDDTNFPFHIWSEQQLVSGTMETILTDVAEYNKFLAAGVTTLQYTKMEARVTSGETFIEGGLPPEAYKFRVQVPSAFYRTGEIQYPTGVIRAVMAYGAIPATGSIGAGGNAYTWTTPRSAVVHFVNGVVAPY